MSAHPKEGDPKHCSLCAKRAASEKWPPLPRQDERSEDMKVAESMAEYTPKR